MEVKVRTRHVLTKQARITRSGRFGGRITIGLHLNELVTHD